ncbi:PREDICTED: mitochondrial coiled-coil domain protein 1 [Miniopterus natalensis]|uniref:mitochondrial coiled-coil domain protein 1 n=1 Tax=Miniopterus natalensis TaxID=291302 RepID=UPI0007A71BBC|nr:PREDICTED: mitochondrial coiled-coil domain protein 1 [Miniopterus natalensis]
MVLLLGLSRCCCRLLLPSWPLVPQGSQRCCSQSPKTSTKEQTSSTGSGKVRSPNTGPGRSTAELAQAEELLEQQLELYQALLEGQEGAWEAQALVLKIQKLKEQMRRHRASLGGET